MMQSAFSNWFKGNVFETDFGAAVVGGGKGAVLPSFVNADGSAQGINLRNSGMCSGRDEAGNWWVGGVMAPAAWEGVDRALRALG